jgi:hypothetical protein
MICFFNGLKPDLPGNPWLHSPVDDHPREVVHQEINVVFHTIESLCDHYICMPYLLGDR